MGERNSRVSVIIPYSPEHTPAEMLEEAKMSANMQSIETEIIVVEDTEQRGPAWARNRGMDKADSRYVAFLDADDIWKENKLTRQLSKMERTGAGICVEGLERSKDQFILDVFLEKTISVTSSILIDTEKVDFSFNEDLYRREDHLFLIQAAERAGVCLCPDLIIVRKQDSGLSATSSPAKEVTAREEFAKLCFEQIEWLSGYKEDYYTLHYYRSGRRWHLFGNYECAVSFFVKSLQTGFCWKTFPALVLSLILMAWNKIIK
mgnify:CR=1 FL=1